MPRSTTSSVFPDVNVWIALTMKAHQHHAVAWNWYRLLAPNQLLVFCRATQLGFLRLITNEAVAKHETLSQRAAWAAYDRWIDKGGAIFMNEPLGLDIEFRDLTDQLVPGCREWNDSYLAAFAKAASLNLITFDRGLSMRASQPVLLTPGL